MQETRLVTNKLTMNRLDSAVRKKAELQARGVRIQPELISELETKYNFPAIRTGRMVLCLESPDNSGELIPAFIVNGKRGNASPLHLVKNNSGKYEVWANDEKYTDITLDNQGNPCISYYDWSTNREDLRYACRKDSIWFLETDSMGSTHLRSGNTEC